MMPWWGLAVLVLGVNFLVWGMVGLVRLLSSLVRRVRRRVALRRYAAAFLDPAPVRSARQPALEAPSAVQLAPEAPTAAQLAPVARPADSVGTLVEMRGSPARHSALTTSDVAVLIPAHNESLVIEETLAAIMELVPRENVHVVSDGSTDGTVAIASAAGAQVIETHENVGKAGALQEAIQRLGLIERFAVVMLLDADTRVEPGYFTAALPLFDSPKVVAVAGCVRTARDRKLSLAGNVLVGHRQRIYAVGQRALKFGQTSRFANATHIVPGFASLYRTEVLPRIDMNPPGLAIEDFNMTFEVYQKGLGQVGFSLSAVAVTQDPDTLHDYVRQTKRWALGLWQTVRRHPPRANLFTAMLTLLLLEAVTSSLMFLLLPLLLLVFVIPDLVGGAQLWPGFGDLYTVVTTHVSLTAVFFGILIPDYALTCVVAALERRPRLLLCGFFFPALRLIDSAIGISAIPLAWLSKSNGVWKSPARRVTAEGQQEVGDPGREALRTGTEVTALPAGGLGRAAEGQPGGMGVASPALMGEAGHASG